MTGVSALTTQDAAAGTRADRSIVGKASPRRSVITGIARAFRPIPA